MNLQQKVFAIVKKDTKEIVMFGLNAREVKEEFDEYYSDDDTVMLHQTFMPQSEIKKQMDINK